MTDTVPVWLAAACAVLGDVHLGLLGQSQASERPRGPLRRWWAGAGGWALASSLAGATSDATLVFSAIALVIGIVLLVLGEQIWRLLDDAPEQDV